MAVTVLQQVVRNIPVMVVMGNKCVGLWDEPWALFWRLLWWQGSSGLAGV